MSSAVSALDAVIYGVVQGLTEFLPISSTAHVRLAQAILNPGADQTTFTAFTAVIQLGTVAAVVLYFWRELLQIVGAWIRGILDKNSRNSLEYRMGWYLIFATIPVGVLGFIFKDSIETGARNLWIIAVALIVMAVILAGAERVGKRNRDEEQVNTTDAIVVGTAQALALVPGVSRSGATITAGLFRGLDRVTAARFSFLLSIPAVVASGIFEARKIGDASGPGIGVTIIATFISFVVGLASIAWLIRYISRHSTFIFIGYRIALGILLIVLLSTNAISATK